MLLVYEVVGEHLLLKRLIVTTYSQIIPSNLTKIGPEHLERMRNQLVSSNNRSLYLQPDPLLLSGGFLRALRKFTS